MARLTFTDTERAWADDVLHGHVKGLKKLGDRTPAVQEFVSNYTHLELLKARVINGETLTDQDLFNARNSLSVADQAELHAFLKENS